MSNKGVPIRIRPANDEDVPFLFSSWLKSFRESGILARGVPNTIFYQNHHKILQKILKRAAVHIACNPNDVSQIYGYMVGEYIEGIFVIHYVYVKHSFRRVGIARELLNSFSQDTGSAACCTHLTSQSEKYLLKYNMIYHPYLVLVDYETPAETTNEGSEVKPD